MKIKVLLLPIAFLLILVGCGTTKNIRLRDSTRVSSQSFLDSIPFEWRFESVVIQIQVPGEQRPWDLIFDTGASYSVIRKDNAIKSGLESVSNISVGDTHGNRKTTPVYLFPEVELGSTTFTNHAAVGVNYDEDNLLRCIAADGILGANLMKKLHWKIDYSRQMIYFSDVADSLPQSPNRVAQEFRFDGGRPHVDIHLNSYRVSNVLIDTGYNGFMDGGPDLIPTLKDTATDTWSYFRKYDGSSFGLWGTDLDTIYRSPNQTLMMADSSFWNYEMEIQSGSGAKMGNRLFKHYDLFLNFPDGIVQWSKRDTVSQYPTEPGWGIGMRYTRTGVVVASLTEGGPAEKAGIEMGDEIEAIDQIPMMQFQGQMCALYEFIRSEKENDQFLKLEIKGKGSFKLEKEYFTLTTDTLK